MPDFMIGSRPLRQFASVATSNCSPERISAIAATCAPQVLATAIFFHNIVERCQPSPSQMSITFAPGRSRAATS